MRASARAARGARASSQAGVSRAVTETLAWPRMQERAHLRSRDAGRRPLVRSGRLAGGHLDARGHLCRGRAIASRVPGCRAHATMVPQWSSRDSRARWPSRVISHIGGEIAGTLLKRRKYRNALRAALTKALRIASRRHREIFGRYDLGDREPRSIGGRSAGGRRAVGASGRSRVAETLGLRRAPARRPGSERRPTAPSAATAPG
jgi:hypothetical protein